MPVTIKRAVKSEAKLRFALSGPSGSGKTYTSLLLAAELAGPNGKVLVLDTERGSASKYADLFCSFDVIELETFSPENYIECIQAGEEGGYDVLVIDSMSHEWMGTGGELELADSIAKRNRMGNSFQAWGEVAPRRKRLMDALLGAKIHVLWTTRAKQDYVVERDEKTGKSVPKKLGMQSIQKEGLEYEADICGDLDLENNLMIMKSRCPELSGKTIYRPDAKFARVIKTWLQGVPPAPEPTPAPAPRIAAIPMPDSPHEKEHESEAEPESEPVVDLGAEVGPVSTAPGQIQGQPRITEGKLKTLAMECGYIAGDKPEELKKSWEFRINQIFGGALLPSDYKKESTLNRIAGAIELFRKMTSPDAPVKSA